jgi:tetratricopeptide (TPR) repeat protein
VVAPSEISYVKSELLQPIRHAAGTTIFSIRENRTSIQTVKRSVLTSTSRRKPEKSVVSTQQRKRQSILNASSPTDANTGHTQRYLTALVALESGKIEEAYKALIGTLFLKPDFIPAIITLGNVSRQEGHKEEAVRHFRTAERLLHSMDPGSIVPGSEGISAKGLLEMVRTLLQSAEK